MRTGAATGNAACGGTGRARNETASEEKNTMHVEVDEPKCVSAGLCVMSAPEVFDQRDDDGVVILLEADPEAGLHDEVREAAGLCPAAAIRLVEQ